MPAPEAPGRPCGQRLRRPTPRRDGEGRRAGADRPDRHLRRPGPPGRVPRSDHPRPVDGGPDDRLQQSIEWGAKAGMVAPDDTTFKYLEGKPHAPRGQMWEKALDH